IKSGVNKKLHSARKGSSGAAPGGANNSHRLWKHSLNDCQRVQYTMCQCFAGVFGLDCHRCRISPPPSGEDKRFSINERKPVMEATAPAHREFNAAEIGALAHLYRGEVYRSTVWRTRLDNTTNWAVAGLGIAFSVSFSSKESSALPLLLIGILITVFLFFEAR